jgi:hypothetical protein
VNVSCTFQEFQDVLPYIPCFEEWSSDSHWTSLQSHELSVELLRKTELLGMGLIFSVFIPVLLPAIWGSEKY